MMLSVWIGSFRLALEEEMATYSSVLAWRIHRQRSLAGYTPWGRKELDTTEHSSGLWYVLRIYFF